MLIEMSGNKQHSHEVHLTSQELARMAHCSRQSLYQAIKLLAQQRVVRQCYGYLEVLDTDKLKRIYEGHD
jgi:CTP-dependent riboflavin kinase